MSAIHSIVYQPRASTIELPYRFNRVASDSVKLIAGHGIEGDEKAGRSAKRHLNILSLETLERLRELGYRTGPGELGEQLVVAGLDVMALEAGTQLQIGARAIVATTFPRTGREWLEKVQGKALSDGLVGHLGTMATVLRSGVIRVGDEVSVLKDP